MKTTLSYSQMIDKIDSSGVLRERVLKALKRQDKLCTQVGTQGIKKAQ